MLFVFVNCTKDAVLEKIKTSHGRKRKFVLSFTNQLEVENNGTAFAGQNL